MEKNTVQFRERFDEYKYFVWEVLKVIVVALLIIVPVRTFLIQPFYVKGASMEPNFYNYEYLIIDELTYRFNEPERGDVVVLKNPQDESQFFIKRIIGLPGEHVEIVDRKVHINGQELDESSYLPDSNKTWGNQDLVVPEGHYFLLGDNRDESLDSRVFGPVPAYELIGRTWLRAWPVDRLDRFTTVDYN